MDQAPRRLRDRPQGAIAVGLLAVVLASLFSIRVLSETEWDATVFVGFGEDASPTREYAEERLGAVFLRIGQGHDGKYFFVQANDPWLVDPNNNAEVLDAPLYRSQRMLYPMLASGFGALGPSEIVWGMLLLNLVALGLGTFAVGVLAQEAGSSAWWGLAFLVNIGFTSELNIGGAGLVAGAAVFGALALLLKGRIRWAVLLLSLSALSREVMLIAAAGTAWYLWRGAERRRATVVALVPVGVVAAWALYLRLRIAPGVGASVQAFGLPFVGLVEAAGSWLPDPIDLVAGLAILALLGLFLMRSVRSDELVGWAFVGFVPMAVLLTKPVWANYFDFTRAVAPVITAFVLLVVASRSQSERTSVRQ